MTLRTRLERGIVVLLAGMPRFLQRLLAGRPREVDGQRLEPEVQLMLRLLELSGPALEELPVPEAREQLAHNAGLVAGPPIDVASVESISIPGPGGPIDARLYTPHIRPDPAPLLVYFHGGGWVLGSLDTHDNAARFVADRAEIKVLSVDYRLAPEHPFPAAVEDAVAAFRFAAVEADRLGVDAEAIAVGGDSAGGNLAAVVCQQQAAEDGPMPAFQMLIYPVTDMSIKRRSYHLFCDGYALSQAEMDWFRGHYLPDEAAAFDPRVSPLLTEDLSGLPPAYIATAGFDPLRDEGEAYAARLREAGVPVAHRRHRGLIHGYWNSAQTGRAARDAALDAIGALRTALALTRVSRPELATR